MKKIFYLSQRSSSDLHPVKRRPVSKAPTRPAAISRRPSMVRSGRLQAAKRPQASLAGSLPSPASAPTIRRSVSASRIQSPATYPLNQTSASLAAYADIDSSDVYAFSTNQGSDTSQAGGTVTVTEIDPVGKTISGTFSFKAFRDIDSRQKTITNGVFTKIPFVTALPRYFFQRYPAGRPSTTKPGQPSTSRPRSPRAS